MARGEDPKLDMTPMIDCVFQLLIFFIVTLKPEDIIAHLDVFRPAPDAKAKPDQDIQDLITIMIMRDVITVNNKAVSMKTLEGVLAKLSSLSKTQTILIKCAGDSKHDKLISVLDLCSWVGLSNLSVMSL